MIVLAVLLLVAVAVVVVFLVVAGFDLPNVVLTWNAVRVSLSPIWIFLLGAVTLFVAELALALLRGGSRRRLAKRRELKRLRDVEAHASGSGSGSGEPGEHGQHRGQVGAAASGAPAQGSPAHGQPAQGGAAPGAGSHTPGHAPGPGGPPAPAPTTGTAAPASGPGAPGLSKAPPPSGGWHDEPR